MAADDGLQSRLEVEVKMVEKAPDDEEPPPSRVVRRQLPPLIPGQLLEHDFRLEASPAVGQREGKGVPVKAETEHDPLVGEHGPPLPFSEELAAVSPPRRVVEGVFQQLVGKERPLLPEHPVLSALAGKQLLDGADQRLLVVARMEPEGVYGGSPPEAGADLPGTPVDNPGHDPRQVLPGARAAVRRVESEVTHVVHPQRLQARGRLPGGGNQQQFAPRAERADAGRKLRMLLRVETGREHYQTQGTSGPGYPCQGCRQVVCHRYLQQFGDPPQGALPESPVILVPVHHRNHWGLRHATLLC